MRKIVFTNRGVSAAGALVACFLSSLVATSGCGPKMSTLRDENFELSASNAKLRADKHKEDLKLRDLQNQIAVLRDQQETAKINRERVGEPPTLPVEVAMPSVAAAPQVVSNDNNSMQGDDGSGSLTDQSWPPQGQGDDRAQTPSANSFSDNDLTGSVASRDDGGDSGNFEDDKPAPVRKSSHSKPARKTAAKHATVDIDADLDAAPTTSAHRSSDPAQAYADGVALIRAHDNAGAIAAFHDFIKRWPHHEFADNAQYWIGEAFYDQKNYDHALTEFRATIDKYPHGNKVPDALLKIGYCYFALGQDDRGRGLLEQVISIYPTSAPAQVAGKRLEVMGQSGSTDGKPAIIGPTTTTPDSGSRK